MRVQLADSDEAIASCFAVMRELRPHLSAESFLARVHLQQRHAGYRLAYVEAARGPVAVAGFAIRETLVDGRYLHVDDLVTLEAERSRGHGAQLLRWLVAHARDQECQSVQLDSGVQRKDAHRFYEREGLEHSALHFQVSLARSGDGAVRYRVG